MEYKELIELLSGHKVYLQTHNFPDPDAIASAFGMQQFLKYHGIDSYICYDGSIDKLSTKRMLVAFGIKVLSSEDIEDMKESDYIVTIDGQKNNANFTDFIGDEVACIDHHPTFIPCDYRYKDVRIVGSCSTLVAEYYCKSNTPLDTNTATALLYGLRMDTDSFCRGVTELDIEMFGYLHPIADDSVLINMFNNVMELEDLRAYGAAIENIVIYDNVGFAHIPFDCPDALIAMVSDFILGLDVVEIAIVYADRDGGYKFSVRNETDKVHAGKLIAQALECIGNGGGHFTMAGGYISSDKISQLGEDIDYDIRTRFLNTIRT